MTNISSPIGVFDSGIGGLSILKALRSVMPAERFVYFADSAHNPYGEKPEAFVVERSLAVARELVEGRRSKALVVACNTATAAAIHVLRAQWPELPIVGVEPALKPAALATRSGRVLVLATRGTLQSVKFAQLKAKLEAEHAASDANNNQGTLQFTCVPCDGLADRIEQLSASGKRWQDAPDLVALCAGFMTASDPFSLKNEEKNKGFDTLVLGCTHYPLIRDAFRSLAGDAVTIVDNAQPVALRTMQLLRGKEAPSEQVGGVVWRSSAEEAQLVQAARYWGVAQD
ncbi:aspartate/glutamate racemase family protein [Variovorax sp. PCZ-1]|uniref:glutamate racemase n=1 Tax=Variovorax sp. PCZ-1 TaxID=2835533 RepID=UPI001BCECCDB|nr:aspartate/glutamate racemase family protein [Variovorax sp. PCZ-1]MBS7806809.1 aspartate/glutamate racemase family protein [Variovorax sp. PCZ-1]